MEKEHDNPDNEVIEQVEVQETITEKQPSEAELKMELERIRAEAERGSKNNTGKIVLIAVLVIVLITLGVFGIMVLRDTLGKKNSDTNNTSSSTTVSGQAINLDEYSNDIQITAGGAYVLTGKIGASIIVDSLEDVTLRLNGVTVEATQTAAIASVGKGALTIEIVEGTENTLSDGGGETDYDGCIFSYGPMTITGKGKLNVYGRQEDGEGIATKSAPITIEGGEIYIESNDDGINTGGDGGTITFNDGTVTIKAGGDGIDSNQDIVINGGTIYAMGSSMGGDAGIDADNGYTINGGTVVALGSDMLETPTQTSKQNVLAFNLSNTIASGALVTLTDNDGNIVVSFVAKETFRTLIISTPKLVNGSYKLYTGGSNNGSLVNNFYVDGALTGGTAVTVNNSAVFTVNSTITTVGNANMRPGGNGGPGGMMPQR